jgi:hypothetical protein
LFGCKKENADLTTQLLSKTWKMSAMDVITPLQGTPLSGLSTNWYAPNGCIAKQTWTYRPNGSLEIKDDSSCIVAGSQSSSQGTWKLLDNNTKIEIQGTWYGNFTYSLISLTENKLTVQKVVPTGVGGSQIIDLLMEYEFMSQ